MNFLPLLDHPSSISSSSIQSLDWISHSSISPWQSYLFPQLYLSLPLKIVHKSISAFHGTKDHIVYGLTKIPTKFSNISHETSNILEGLEDHSKQYVASHFSRVQLFVTLWTIGSQVPLSMGFSRQEYWTGLPCLIQGNFPTQGLNLRLSPAFGRWILYH